VTSTHNPSPHVAVVVLSWNGRDETLACLASLNRVDYEPLSVIVVDNASQDRSADAVAAEFPSAILVRNEENLGYAGGMNAGLDAARERGSDAFLLLNNDVEVDPAFVGALVEEAGRRPEAAALCSKIFFADSPDLIWYAGARFDPRKGYNGRHIGYGEHDSERFQGVAETERACGAAMLIPRTALDEVGVFDESLFAYAEDTEWSLRARERGRSLLVVPASRIWHKISSASGGEGSPTALYYSVRNTLTVCERHAPLGPVGTWRRRTVVILAHAIQSLRLPRQREGLRAIVAGWRDFRAGRLGPRRPS
jgi:GT2 family glycosyltransferase